ncbi:MAG: TonB-dependent receptor [Bacteroidales bacterium]
MRYIPAFIISFILFSTHLNAQYQGKIISSENGDVLQFAVIKTITGNIAVLSDVDGRFKIDENMGDIISVEVSYLGYVSDTFQLSQNRFTILSLKTDYNQIGEVEVTATRFHSSLRRAAGSISLLGPEILAENNSPTINHIINQSPGVFMADGTLSTNRLIIRGIGSRNPYGTNRIRIYLDDIPVTSVDGSSSPENFNPEVLERIEILKGPSSAVYGAGLGGTILLKPDFTAKKGLSLDLDNALRSWSGYEGSVSLRGKTEKTSAVFNARLYDTEGYRQNNDYNRKDIFFANRYTGEKINVTLLLNYLDLMADIPSSLNEEDYLESPWKAAGSWLSVEGFEDYSNFSGGLKLDYNILPGISATSGIFINYNTAYESRPFNIYDADQFGAGMRQIFSYNSSEFKLEVGYEVILEQNSWEIYETLSGTQSERLNAIDEDRVYLSAFLHSEITVLPRLRIEPAISITSISYELEDKFQNEEDLSGQYSYDPAISPRLGLNYTLSDFFNIYASVGHGFSPPSLEETLLPEGEANTELRPESGWTYDAGFRGNLLESRLYYDLGIYYIRLQDLLLIERITEDQFIGINAGETEHYGLEFYLRYLLVQGSEYRGHSLLFNSSMTFSENRFLDFVDDNVDYSGKELPGIPSLVMNYGLDYRYREHWKIYLNFNIFGKQFMNDDNSRLYKGHELLNLRTSYDNLRINDRFSLNIYLGINNLLDKRYASMILVNAPSFGGSQPRYYYPGNPRNFVAGIKLSIN